MAALEQVSDLRAAPGTAFGDLFAIDDDVIDVEKAVLLKADIDERCFEACDDVLDLRFETLPTIERSPRRSR